MVILMMILAHVNVETCGLELIVVCVFDFLIADIFSYKKINNCFLKINNKLINY